MLSLQECHTSRIIVHCMMEKWIKRVLLNSPFNSPLCVYYFGMHPLTHQFMFMFNRTIYFKNKATIHQNSMQSFFIFFIFFGFMWKQSYSIFFLFLLENTFSMHIHMQNISCQKIQHTRKSNNHIHVTSMHKIIGKHTKLNTSKHKKNKIIQHVKIV